MSFRTNIFPDNARARYILIAAMTVILVAVAIFIRREFPPALSPNVTPPAYVITPFEVLGSMAAAQTENLAGSNGKIVICKIQDLQQTPLTLRTLHEAYDKRIAQNAGLRIVAQVEERVDLATALNHPDVATLSGARFLALLDQYRDVDLIVLLGAVPALSQEDYAHLPTHRPKVLAVDTMRLPAKRLFDDHVLQAAIVMRVPPSTDSATTPTEWTDKLYMLVTPENSAVLPR